MAKLNGLSSIAMRVCFLLGVGMLVLVLTEELVRFTGATLLSRAYNQETLLDVSVSFFVVVIALLLRQIRDGLKGGGPATG